MLYKGQWHKFEGGFPDVLSFQKSPKCHSPQEREEQTLSKLSEFLGLGKPLPTHCTSGSSQQLPALIIQRGTETPLKKLPTIYRYKVSE